MVCLEALATSCKPHVLAEFAAQRRLSAIEDRKKAEDPKLSTLQISELVNIATERETNLRKLNNKINYRLSFLRRLLKWIGANFTTAEVVSSISALEAGVRRKLTWQERDPRFWLARLSPLVALSAEKVAATREFRG